MSVDAMLSRYRRQKPTLPAPLVLHWDRQREARCRGVDPSTFYSSSRKRGADRAIAEWRVKAICQRCVITVPSREYVLKSNEP